jgi:hypothetical protein
LDRSHQAHRSPNARPRHFQPGHVLRSSNGWRITDAGRAFLAECEVPISYTPQESASEAVKIKSAGRHFAAGIGDQTRHTPLDLASSPSGEKGRTDLGSATFFVVYMT